MADIKAEIISIGDELLYGQIMDTNSHWISQQLDQIGVKVVRKTTIGDNTKDILAAFKHAEHRANIILITGGLGPTRDDLTKPLMAEYFNCDIQLVPEAKEDLQKFFARRGKELTHLNELQAHLPTKCTYVPNKMGTAPGMWFEENGCIWMSMPGVPHEMKNLIKEFVIPKIKSLFKLPSIYHKVIKTVGIGESWLADLIRDWEDQLPGHIKLAYLPSLGEVKLRLTAFGKDQSQLQMEVADQIEKVLPMITAYVYGYDQDSLETVVGRLLKASNKKVALAESCTGGYISHLITSIAGSSDYYNGSIVPYHNEFKAAELGVSRDTLEKHGAVSEETVTEMAALVRKKFKADYGLASSGVAGPGGGTPEKPVGTVWIACATHNQVTTKKLQLGEERMLNIQRTGVGALNLLRKVILNDTV
ncbi:competence/damage-inducible protein A [Echinicola jeungdonensis]|uniref:CinA-like protein n=1 Tax=Echinicola jeungdonensis TaxID=709343 RepID=A0ABV5J9D0_9BACT|nr:competence/damage-inducible protein A [Echinicola jeungdonensis]MDN3670205.1 competence/damage-inducible protein A [Echinicola jeungdonensis]